MANARSQLSPEQETIVRAPLDGGQICFLSGPAGVGKSALLSRRLVYLLEQGVPAYSILVLLPDRPARERLQEALRGIPLGPYGDLSLQTYYSLAQRMVALFWPLVARPAGFAHPERPPIFLTYELAQHHLRRIVAPFLEQGYFDGLHLHPQRLLSQLLDNLNKAALNGYPLGEVLARLQGTWSGPPDRLAAFRQAQECIERFRSDCLEHGFLDLSLTLEVFQRHLLDNPPFWEYFGQRYRHLLVDNVEENTPIAHAFIARLLPHCASGLVVYDEGGGYRDMLGADPAGALLLRSHCAVQVHLAGTPGPAAALAGAISGRLGPGGSRTAAPFGAILGVIQTRYRSEMIAAVAERLAHMVQEEGLPPQEIAVLAPYLDGVLRFALGQECARLGVPLRVLRRYRRPADEPAVRALLTLAAILCPQWGIVPQRYDAAEALAQALEGLDAIRAALLADWAYDPLGPAWRHPDSLSATARARLGSALLERYRAFYERWQAALPAAALPWESLLAHLLGTVLSAAVGKPATATACAELLESARRFRHLYPALHAGERPADVGKHYLEMLRSGLVTAQYLVREQSAPAVLLAPAHSYLLAGEPVRRQFWLDVASPDWWTPPQQPLTNPHVLARSWPQTAPWDDAADYAARQAALARIVQGLCNRCREGIVLCSSELSTSGQTQDGPLLRALEPFLADWKEGGTA